MRAIETTALIAFSYKITIKINVLIIVIKLASNNLRYKKAKLMLGFLPL